MVVLKENKKSNIRILSNIIILLVLFVFLIIGDKLVLCIPLILIIFLLSTFYFRRFTFSKDELTIVFPLRPFFKKKHVLYSSIEKIRLKTSNDGYKQNPFIRLYYNKCKFHFLEIQIDGFDDGYEIISLIVNSLEFVKINADLHTIQRIEKLFKETPNKVCSRTNTSLEVNTVRV